MNSLNGVSLFVQVAESGSFVEAARLAGVSPSAASKSISRLEQRLAARLFHRSTRSLSLTTEGKIYLETCRQVLAEMQSVESRLGKSVEQPQGVLRISLPMVSGFLLPALSDFSASHPTVQLDMEFTDRLVDVIAEGFDIVIRTGPLQDSRLSARPLTRFRGKVVGSPDYFKRKGKPKHPAELENHDCLHYRFPHSGKTEQWSFVPQAKVSELRLPTAMVCNSLEARIHYAKQGMGIAWVPDFSVSAELKDGALLSVLDEFIAHADAFSMVWPSGRQTISKLRAFIDFMSSRPA
ncbi:LysR family transcriptional regulator [Burkholderia gladioli]|uniref:LysR family transcriptional regulator n=1 Tax=Burkholderia gladioli TaxID=28095 RepID=UPI00236485CD|nr:LysR family transcriptional regulator [Burkholderia gladioli]MDD1786470.1 LysR family transcriptional regulator [Burkholderia gladioli]